MRVGEIKQSGLAVSDVPAPDASQASKSRALVALAPPPARSIAAGRRHAPFLAQLLAIKDLHPQTCARRRIAPHEAIAAYRGMAALIAH